MAASTNVGAQCMHVPDTHPIECNDRQTMKLLSQKEKKQSKNNFICLNMIG